MTVLPRKFVCLAVVVFTAFGSLTASAKRDMVVSPEDVFIEIAQMGHDQWRIAYNFSRPVMYVDLGKSLNGFRAADWHVETDGIEIVTRDGRDYLQATDGKRRFDTTAVMVKAKPLRLLKHYEPIRNLGKDGAIVYTGHFWPWSIRGGRVKASFFFKPQIGARVSVFGLQAASVDRWQSIFNHPAFVYFGPLQAVETDDVVVIADPAAPNWIAAEFHRAAPPLLDHLATIFEVNLRTKPNIFLAFEKGGPYGLMRYSGDALPGQFQLSLYGGGWKLPTELGIDLLRRAMAHEAVHLWQTAISPLDDDVPGWIHEGAADAIAAEALVALGYWTGEDAAHELKRATNECADELRDGSLADAERRGSIRAFYACGHILVEAAARAHNDAASVADFWRDFAERATERGGYDAEMFFKLVEEVGGEDLSRAMRYFERTPLARPSREINQLLSMAQSAP